MSVVAHLAKLDYITSLFSTTFNCRSFGLKLHSEKSKVLNLGVFLFKIEARSHLILLDVLYILQ